MTYTSDSAPKRPGFYWVRHRDCRRVVEVWQARYGQNLCADVDEVNVPPEDSSWERWHGPLAPPEGF